jgi:hypothetical protein
VLQARPILLWHHVTAATVRNRRALVVRVPQPKAEWWRRESAVPVFELAGAADFSPVRLWQALCQRSPHVSASPASTLPAFHRASGSPLTQAYMTERVTDLIRRAGFSLVDDRGRVLAVMAASYRAGGVRSAVDAGLEEAVIMELGRWHSSAWTNYLLFTNRDLCLASERMWHFAAAEVDGSSPHSRHLRMDAERHQGMPHLARADEQAAMQVGRDMMAQSGSAWSGTLRIGDRVHVRGQQWGLATVTRDNGDGSFNLRWDSDMDQEWSVQREHIVIASS